MISTIIERIGVAFTTIVMTLMGTVAPVALPEPNLGAQLPQAAAIFETSLAAPITSAATTMTLAANSVRGGGTLSGYNCFTIDEGSAQAEFVCGTVSGTSVTSMTRGISPLTGTSTIAALQFAHRRGANVKITDFPVLQILKAQANGEDTYANVLTYGSAVSIATSSNQIPYASWIQNAITSQAIITTGDQTVAGAKTFTGTTTLATTTTSSSTAGYLNIATGTVTATPVNANDIANKAYVDAVSIVGASDADETTKGIVEEATLAEVQAGTATGATGASLYVAPDKLALFTPIAVTHATTTAVYLDQSVSMDANDVLMVWASSNINAAASCAGSATQSMTLIKKSSTLAASSTMNTIRGDTNQGCSFSAFFTHVSTTTETMRVGMTIADGLGRTPVNSLMTQLIKK